jgi:hypothetical protein
MFYWEKDEKTMDYGDTSGDVVGIDQQKNVAIMRI